MSDLKICLLLFRGLEVSSRLFVVAVVSVGPEVCFILTVVVFVLACHLVQRADRCGSSGIFWYSWKDWEAFSVLFNVSKLLDELHLPATRYGVKIFRRFLPAIQFLDVRLVDQYVFFWLTGNLVGINFLNFLVAVVSGLARNALQP